MGWHLGMTSLRHKTSRNDVSWAKGLWNARCRRCINAGVVSFFIQDCGGLASSPFILNQLLCLTCHTSIFLFSDCGDARADMELPLHSLVGVESWLVLSCWENHSISNWCSWYEIPFLPWGTNCFDSISAKNIAPDPWGFRKSLTTPTIEHCWLVTPLLQLKNTLLKSECKKSHLALSYCLQGESVQQGKCPMSNISCSFRPEIRCDVINSYGDVTS